MKKCKNCKNFDNDHCLVKLPIVITNWLHSTYIEGKSDATNCELYKVKK